jgi:ubiquinone/menaquinone biosynthesis C-methylase UbiE
MFVQPSDVIASLGMPAGSIVADFGAGTGAYTIASAITLGGSGRVYGVDVQKDLLVRLKSTATSQGLGNVDVIWGDCEKVGGTTLRDQSVDFVIIANMLFQAPDKATVLKEAKRVLRPGGRGHLLVVDWSGSFKNMGPTKEQVLTEIEAKKLAESIGFITERPIPAGTHHYGVLFHT